MIDARAAQPNQKNTALNGADVIDQFCRAMREQDIHVSPAAIVADGKLHRIRADGDRDKTVWFVLHDDDRPVGMFGCNRRYGYDQKFTWKADIKCAPLTTAEKRAYRKRIERMEAERAAELAEARAAAAKRAQRIWDEAAECGTHAYLDRKGVRSHGLRVGRYEVIDQDTGEVRTVTNQALLIPIRDLRKKIHSLQAIMPEKREGAPDKWYLQDGAKEGHFWTIGRPLKHDGKQVLIIGEGFATCASIHEATGHAVIVAFDAPNLLPVAKVWRARFPDATIVIAADNDQFTLRPVANPGVTRAREAAAAVGGLVAIPPFDPSLGATNEKGGRDHGPTDMNDLQHLEGAEAICGVIDAVLNSQQPEAVDTPADEDASPSRIVFVPTEDEAMGVDHVNECLARLDDKLRDCEIVAGVRDAVDVEGRSAELRGTVFVPYGRFGLELSAKLAAAVYLGVELHILAAPGDEAEAHRVGQLYGALVSEPDSGDDWRGWGEYFLDMLFSTIDADDDLAVREFAERVIEQARGADDCDPEDDPAPGENPFSNNRHFRVLGVDEDTYFFFRKGKRKGDVKVKRLTISNFRGVAHGVIHLAGHTLLVGGNNVGKSTVCEALDLVLGPERLYRRPVIDEHDFYCSRYLDDEKEPIEVRIEAVLTDLPQEAELRFHRHLRRWDDVTRDFADQGAGGPADGDGTQKCWALPVVFIGRYDRTEDDFVGNTFFDHPIEPLEDDEAAELALGTGRRLFGREHKRLCGFVFLRTLRTGSRALSLQRGSLLDTVLRLGGTGLADMWKDTLDRLQGMAPPIGEVPQLKQIRTDIRERMARFVSLAPGDSATAFFASELTRENLREVVRLFIAAEPVGHSIPFARLGTGSINLLVFALLTVIAELKEKQSVIFAMEEPEIALSPHTQRRVSRFVLTEMGQAIITSHSPYVIEQFEPQDIVILSRRADGVLEGAPIDLGDFKTKSFKTERRQFAEAILGRGILVVEGASEAALFPEASTVLENDLRSDAYMHLDFSGISLFNADAETAVPKYGPVFKALNKAAFAFYDKPNKPHTAEAAAKLGDYVAHWQSPTKGIEVLLVSETTPAVHRRFLVAARARDDYPNHCGVYDALIDDDATVHALAIEVLKARKGDAYGYTALFIRQCHSADELPATIKKVLLRIDAEMKPLPPVDIGDLFE